MFTHNVSIYRDFIEFSTHEKTHLSIWIWIEIQNQNFLIYYLNNPYSLKSIRPPGRFFYFLHFRSTFDHTYIYSPISHPFTFWGLMQPFDNLKSAMKFTEMLPRDFPSCLPKMGSKRKYWIWLVYVLLCCGLVDNA